MECRVYQVMKMGYSAGESLKEEERWAEQTVGEETEVATDPQYLCDICCLETLPSLAFQLTVVHD